tara:strand:- start:130 stop:426 length:297 start_codon:yes stop_codon:yes gene_type:complete
MSIFRMADCKTGELDAAMDAEHLVEVLGEDPADVEQGKFVELGHFGTGSDEADACLGMYGFSVAVEPEPQEAPPPRQRKEDQWLDDATDIYNLIREVA